MSIQFLNLINPKDLEEFFRSIGDFGFKALIDHTQRLILIEGDIEYFGYYGYDGFKAIVVRENAELTLTWNKGRYLVTLKSPGKFKQYELPAYIVIEYKSPYLAIEY